jgi:hypothetical protein
MVRVFRHKQKWGVYVGREVGERHHLPHAHIQVRGQRVATVFLLTLEYEFVLEELPASLLDEIRERQEVLLDTWEEVNA